jgi:hypothetical protein
MTFIPDKLITSDECALNAALWRLLARGWSRKRAVAALLTAWNEDHRSEDGLVERALDIPDEDAGKTPQADIYAAAAEAWGLSRKDAKARLCWSLYGSGPQPFAYCAEHQAKPRHDRQPAHGEIVGPRAPATVSVTGVTKEEALRIKKRLWNSGLMSFYRASDKSVNMHTTSNGAELDRETLLRVVYAVRSEMLNAKEERLKQNEDSRGEY